MSWSTDLLTGIAAYLASKGRADWRPDGSVYLPTETALCLTRLPADPDRAVALSLYTIDADGTGNVLVGLQVRSRAGVDPDGVLSLADGIRYELDGLNALDLGGVVVNHIFHRAGEDIGADQGEDVNRRCQRVDNFYVQAKRITPLQPIV